MDNYDRYAAVTYAKTYALNPNPAYKFFGGANENGDCTNFVSQCLYAGGIPMDFNSQTQSWWYLDNKWSLSWTVAHSFYWCLKTRAEKKLSGPKGFETNDIFLLRIGDVICYENYKSIIYHSAIITDFENNYPLISQHTYNALDIPYIKAQASKMHYMKISG